MSRIREEYVDTGKVRFAYKNYAILGPDSAIAAEASECAADQSAFWDFHDAVYADQLANRTPLNVDNLSQLAASLNLDTDAFRECLESGRYRNQIQQDAVSIQSLGIRGTPAFLIGGMFVSGAQPFEVFQQIIEEQLAE